MITSWRRHLPVLLLFGLLLPACAPSQPLFPTMPPPPKLTEEEAFQRAEKTYLNQDYREAARLYADYLNSFPKGKHVPLAHLREAELLGQRGDWQGALRGYQALLALSPEPDIALKARYGTGRDYFKLGQYQQATQVLDNLTAGDLPRSLWFSTQALLAEIALKQGNVAQAFARLRLAAQDLASGDQEWFDDLKSRLLDAAAPAEMERLVSLYPDSPLSAALMLRLARLAQEAGRPRDAARWLDTLRERFPNSPETAAAQQLLTGRGGGRAAVGCLLPLSGELSGLGFKVQRGAELAARGTPLELLFRDTHNDPATAAQLVQELAKEPRLVALLGPLAAPVSQSAAEAAQGAGLPLIALSQKPGLTQVGGSIFRAFLTPRQQVRALLRFTLGKLGLKRYAILYPDSPYGRTFLENFQAELEAQGGELTAQDFYAAGSRELAPTLAALGQAFKGQADQTPEALFIPDDAAAVAAVAAQLPGTPLAGIRLLGTNLLQAPRTQQAGALEGILFPDAFFAGDSDPEVQQFVGAYRQQYGVEPDYLAAQGYVTVKVLAQLLESAKSVSRQDLPRLLLGLREVPDLPWFKGFNQDREEESLFYILTIKEGRVQMAQGPFPGL